MFFLLGIDLAICGPFVSIPTSYFLFSYSVENIIWNFYGHYTDSFDYFWKYNHFHIINSVFHSPGVKFFKNLT